MAQNKKERQEIFNRLWRENKLTEIRTLLLSWLEDEPDDHWLLVQMAETLYLQEQFKEATEYAEKAWKADRHCPLAVWEHAECLYRLGRHREAEPLYKHLIRRGVNRIANGQCSEGIRYARTLVNDSRYTLGLIAAGRGDFGNAKKLLRQHISYRHCRWESRFKLPEVKRDLAQIVQGKDPCNYRQDSNPAALEG